jgi:hypothetical protein
MFELKPKNVGFLDTPTRVMNYAAVEKADDGGQLGGSNASSWQFEFYIQVGNSSERRETRRQQSCRYWKEL